ncbi:hypothetical protein, partial [Caballeronia sp. NCTM5]|uniref:hypothetical protein n=1 Tax=Caballeronia sp. NCTM5 TaxID=2921755 RepID=UPI0020281D6B
STNSEIAKLEKSLTSSATKFSALSESGKQLAANSQAAYARLAQLRSALDGLEVGDAAFKKISAAVVAAERDLLKAE